VRLLQPLLRCPAGHCQTCGQAVDLDRLLLHASRRDDDT